MGSLCYWLGICIKVDPALALKIWLEDEAVGFLPQNNRHLQDRSLSFLQPKAGERWDAMHITHPLLPAKSGCGEVDAFDSRAWWVERQHNSNPKTQ